jgi:hypothetical protein
MRPPGSPATVPSSSRAIAIEPADGVIFSLPTQLASRITSDSRLDCRDVIKAANLASLRA